MVREPIADFHRDGALTAVSTAVTLGTTVHAPSAVCADARNPTIVFNDSTQYLCSLLRRPTWGLGLLFITGTNIVIASLLAEFNVIYEVVSQCIMMLDIYRY